jgi:hypothetical protein
MTGKLQGWPLLDCAGLLAGVIELSTVDAPVDLALVQSVLCMLHSKPF